MINHSPINILPENVQKKLFNTFEVVVNARTGNAKTLSGKPTKDDLLMTYLFMKDISNPSKFDYAYLERFVLSRETAPARAIAQYDALDKDEFLVEGIAANPQFANYPIAYINSLHPFTRSRVKKLQREGKLPQERGPYSLGAAIRSIRRDPPNGIIRYNLILTAMEDAETSPREPIQTQALRSIQYLKDIIGAADGITKAKNGLYGIEAIIDDKRGSAKILLALKDAQDVQRRGYTSVDKLPEGMPFGVVGLGGSTVIEKHFPDHNCGIFAESEE